MHAVITAERDQPASYQESSELTTMRERLDYISSLESVDKQFLAFQVDCNYWASPIDLPFNGDDTQDFDTLIDFAASPESSPSLLVRAQALEFAISKLRGDDLSDGLSDRADKLAMLLPEGYARFGLALQQRDFGDTAEVMGHHLGAEEFIPFNNLVYRLRLRDGIQQETMYPDYDNHDYFGLPIDLPAMAMLLLKQLADRQTQKGSLPISSFSKLIPLALEMGQAYDQAYADSFFSIAAANATRFIGQSRLTRLLNYGEDHAGQIEAFLNSDNDETSLYVEVLNDIYDKAEGLKTAFPEKFSDAVETSVRELIASSMYALHYHVINSHRTDVKLPLNQQPDALKLALQGDEPLMLLRALSKAFEQISEAINYQEVVLATPGDGFSVYRFINAETADGTNNVSVYVRPYGSVHYDPVLEYGRNGEGVEASINFVADPTLHPSQLLEIGKHRQPGPDNRISIRLDREGVKLSERGEIGVHRDPTQSDGTLSLDVGSILGNDEWLGTKVGRFLAWGNLLRSRETGIHANLNHVTHYMSDKDGQASVFASQAHSLIEELEARRVGSSRLIEIYSGRLALAS